MNEELYELIQNYQAPKHAHEVVAAHPSLNFTGPTGAGKGTLVTYLTQTGDYAPVVSDTTRAPRPHNDGYEVNGVSYWFLSEDEAITRLKLGAYIEAKAVHRKSMYGTSVTAYQRVVDAGRTPVLEIDPQGIEELMGHFPEFESIFLLPPDFDTWQARLDGRGRMQTEEKLQRLTSAIDEITMLLSNDRFYPVINTEVIDTAALISSDEYKNPEYRAKANEVAKELLARTKAFLHSQSIQSGTH
jgi:guanylate kinase